MGRYFGTDGIRGVAGELLTPDLAVRVGRAAATVLAASRGPASAVRPAVATPGSPAPCSRRPWWPASPAAEAVSKLAGVIPTPGLAALVLQQGADAGVVVSASHNPFEDNGIKFFSHEGLKLSDDEEAGIESLLHAEVACVRHDAFGGVEVLERAGGTLRRRPRRASLSGSRRVPRGRGLRQRRHSRGRRRAACAPAAPR